MSGQKPCQHVSHACCLIIGNTVNREWTKNEWWVTPVHYNDIRMTPTSVNCPHNTITPSIPTRTEHCTRGTYQFYLTDHGKERAVDLDWFLFLNQSPISDSPTMPHSITLLLCPRKPPYPHPLALQMLHQTTFWFSYPIHMSPRPRNLDKTLRQRRKKSLISYCHFVLKLNLEFEQSTFQILYKVFEQRMSEEVGL